MAGLYGRLPLCCENRLHSFLTYLHFNSIQEYIRTATLALVLIELGSTLATHQ